MKFLKILAWILLFPFMFAYWGWKNNKIPVMYLGVVLSALFIAIGAISAEDESKEPIEASLEKQIEDNSIDENDTVDTEEANANLDEPVEELTEEPTEEPVVSGKVEITMLEKVDEYIIITNNRGVDANLNG